MNDYTAKPVMIAGLEIALKRSVSCRQKIPEDYRPSLTHNLSKDSYSNSVY